MPRQICLSAIIRDLFQVACCSDCDNLGGQKKIDWNISGFLRSHAIARDLYRSLRKWKLSLSNSNRSPNPPHLTTHVHHYNIQWGLSSRLPDSQKLSHVLKNLWCQRSPCTVN